MEERKSKLTISATKENRAELLSDRAFQRIFESIVGLNLVLTPELKICAVTNSYLAATMTTRHEILGKGIFEVFPDNPGAPDSLAVSNFARSFELVLQTKMPHTMALQRYDIRNPGNAGVFEVRYWSPINTPILDTEGNVEFIIHRVEDVTDFVAGKTAGGNREKQTQLLLDRNYEMEVELVQRAKEILAAKKTVEEHETRSRQLQSLIDAMPDGVLVVDSDHCITLANEQCHRMFGFPPTALIDSNLQSLIRESVTISDSHVVLTKPSDEITWKYGKHQDGSEFPIHVTCGIVNSDDHNQKIYSIRDLSDLHRVQHELLESEKRYHSVLDNMLEAAQIISFDWRYLYLNDAAARNGKQNKDEMLGHTLTDRFPGIDRTEMFSVLEECMAHRLTMTQDFEFTYPDGSVAWFEFNIQPVPEGLFVLSLEITDRKRKDEESRITNLLLDQMVQERTVQLREANKELESFSYSVSHDLRAPLRHIHGYVDMLSRSLDGQLDEKSQRYLKVISDSSIQMGHLIDDLLAFSRMGRQEYSENVVSTDEIVNETVRAISAETDTQHINWSIGPLPQVFGDPSMLSRVFTNLIQNAVKYSRDKNPAYIEIGVEHDDGEFVTFFVRDNGAGFEMAYVHKLFGVFQRLHRQDEFEGTGIGLAIVRRIVNRHGGKTWAEGEVGKGATFFFSLKKA